MKIVFTLYYCRVFYPLYILCFIWDNYNDRHYLVDPYRLLLAVVLLLFLYVLLEIN